MLVLPLLAVPLLHIMGKMMGMENGFGSGKGHGHGHQPINININNDNTSSSLSQNLNAVNVMSGSSIRY
ncbi:hypothetical protein CI807_13130 [Pseudomonas sp. NS1(2017)]|uniref:hypothetical protein n=1 Tax=Pseudomonas sp. NS1(2017) TaxID=2025658 RepID=UPI000BA28731|nr:hypothetical protein [Pseudomonas sp. NS1(2017)]ASV37082.1 hypothetical protein CI807_13130 [Pseudomonas sp. NS1(2017)]